MTIDYDKFWDEVITNAQKENIPQREGEITVAEFAERMQWTVRIAYGFLEAGVRDGKWKKRNTTIDGHRKCVYYPSSL